MLRSTKEMKNYVIGATDGEIGHVTDFFFDDQSWVIRYLVVETGPWLMSRKVLISPYGLMEADWMHKRLPVRITKEQVKNSPDIDTHMPVSRQNEMAHADYYGYPYYWGDSSGVLEGASLTSPTIGQDPNLRSCEVVIGYRIHASDGDIGHVKGMLVDEETWSIRYLVVNDFWSGNEVLVSPDWVKCIDWEDSKVTLDVLRQAVKDSPNFESSTALNREQETAIHRHYQRPAYWERAQQLGLTDAQD
jgi:hypothetical protein